MADSGSPATPHDAYAALRYPNFSRYIVALFALTIGIQIQGTVVGWQVYELTHDPLALGLVGLAEAMPALSFALYAGHIVDLKDRRGVLIAALSVLVGCSLALWVLAGPRPLGNELLNPARLTAIYSVIIVSGVARAFLQPARQAFSAELVPRELFTNAITWRSGTWQLAAVLGPATGGVLYAVGGSRLAYLVDTGLMALAVAILLGLKHRSPVRAETGEGILTSLTAGVRFVFREPVILGALTLDLFAVLFGGAVALLPIFAAEILFVGPAGLGVLRAAPAIGAVTSSILIARHREFSHTGRALLLATAGFGVAMILFGLSTTFLVSVGLLIAAGMCDMVSVVIRSTLLQTRTPEAMLGRVSAVNQIFIGSSNEIGAFESGVAARWLGTARSVVLGGMATLGVVAAVAWFVPTLRKLRRVQPEERTGV